MLREIPAVGELVSMLHGSDAARKAARAELRRRFGGFQDGDCVVVPLPPKGVPRETVRLQLNQAAYVAFGRGGYRLSTQADQMWLTRGAGRAAQS